MDSATPEEAGGPVNLGMKSPPCPICSRDRQQRCLSLQVQPNIMILPHCEHGSVRPEMKRINSGKQGRKKRFTLRDGSSCLPFTNTDITAYPVFQRAGYQR